MNRTLLVALREYRQIAATRGFWVMLLVIPLAIAASQFASRLIVPPLTSAYIIVDPSGQYAPAIEHRIDLARQRELLGELSSYARRWKVDKTAPGAIWATGQSWFSDAEVEGFIAAGGVPAALRAIAPHLPADATAFKPSPARFIRASVPSGVPTDQGPERFGAAIGSYLKGDIATSGGKKPLGLAVYIPPEPGPSSGPVRIWTDGRSNETLIDIVRSELTRVMKGRALQASGLDPQVFTQIESLTPSLLVTAPPRGSGRELVAVRSIIPLALVYLLLISVMVTGSLMLQGVIEEKSNKLLESVLACIRPRELMTGKLLGLGAVGLTVVFVWAGCAVGAAFALQGVLADVLRPSLASLNHPWIAAALVFYFLAGYLIVSMIYLAIGALSNSMQDAQAYLMPVVMALLLPTMFLIFSSLQNPNGLLPQVMSWIPIYTPFAMLARLGSGVSPAEVLGTSAMLLVFVVLELFFLGRLFQASLLRTGQPPKLGAFVKLMMRSDPA